MERSHSRLSDARRYREHLFYISVVLLLSLLSVAKADGQLKPANFDAIKELLESYARADDLMDERLLAARESLRAQSDEAVPALMILFKDNADEYYRGNIVDVFQFSRARKLAVTSFLEEQLAGDVEHWQGPIWVARAISCIATHDPRRGRSIALKALNAKANYIMQAAIKTLGDVGMMEDVDTLRACKKRRELAIRNPRDGMLSLFDDATKRIKERSSSAR